MLKRRVENPTHCGARKSRYKVNASSQPFVHVSWIHESVNGEDETHTHHEQRNDGKRGSGSTQVQHVHVYRWICFDNFIIGVSEKVVISALRC